MPTKKWTRRTRPLLYVSGPMYSEGLLPANVNFAVWAAEVAYMKGWAPVIPHLDCLAQFITGRMDIKRYMDVDYALVAASDGMLVLPYTLDIGRDGQPSGTFQEVEFAKELGIPLYDAETLPWIE